jgi:hypothetical protein
MKGDGINTGTIDVWWDVDKQDSSNVHPGSITPSDADLALAIQRVKTAGMKVMFEPKVWCPSCQPMHWRGILKPKNRTAFFESYGKMINHYADLSQQSGVEHAAGRHRRVEADRAGGPRPLQGPPRLRGQLGRLERGEVLGCRRRGERVCVLPAVRR